MKKRKQPSSEDTSSPLLRLAIERNDLDEVRRLLRIEGDRTSSIVRIDEKDRNGTTLLHLAAKRGRSMVVRELLRVGADPNVRDRDGCTALHKVCTYSKRSTREEYNRRLDATVALLEANANPNAQDEDGWAPLHCATIADAFEDTRIFSTLIDAGADPNVRTSSSSTPLCFVKRATSASILLAAGARTEVRRDGLTPLHYAAVSGNALLVRALLVGGADVNARDDNGRTPLHLSLCSVPSPSVVDELIAAGADVESIDNDGRTPYAILMLQTEAGGPFDRRILLPRLSDALDRIRHLLDIARCRNRFFRVLYSIGSNNEQRVHSLRKRFFKGIYTMAKPSRMDDTIDK